MKFIQKWDTHTAPMHSKDVLQIFLREMESPNNKFYEHLKIIEISGMREMLMVLIER